MLRIKTLPRIAQIALWKSIPRTGFVVINCCIDRSSLPHVCVCVCVCWGVVVFMVNLYTSSAGFECGKKPKPDLCQKHLNASSVLLLRLSLCRRAHTLTVLFILTCALVYVTLLEETPLDTAYNTKRYDWHAVSVSFTFSTETRMQFTSLENEKRYFLKWSDVDRNDT